DLTPKRPTATWAALRPRLRSGSRSSSPAQVMAAITCGSESRSRASSGLTMTRAVRCRRPVRLPVSPDQRATGGSRPNSPLYAIPAFGPIVVRSVSYLLRQDRLPLPRGPAPPARVLPDLDPEGRQQPRHAHAGPSPGRTPAPAAGQLPTSSRTRFRARGPGDATNRERSRATGPLTRLPARVLTPSVSR